MECTKSTDYNSVAFEAIAVYCEQAPESRNFVYDYGQRQVLDTFVTPLPGGWPEFDCSSSRIFMIGGITDDTMYVFEYPSLTLDTFYFTQKIVGGPYLSISSDCRFLAYLGLDTVPPASGQVRIRDARNHSLLFSDSLSAEVISFSQNSEFLYIYSQRNGIRVLKLPRVRTDRFEFVHSHMFSSSPQVIVGTNDGNEVILLTNVSNSSGRMTHFDLQAGTAVTDTILEHYARALVLTRDDRFALFSTPGNILYLGNTDIQVYDLATRAFVTTISTAGVHSDAPAGMFVGKFSISRNGKLISGASIGSGGPIGISINAVNLTIDTIIKRGEYPLSWTFAR